MEALKAYQWRQFSTNAAEKLDKYPHSGECSDPTDLSAWFIPPKDPAPGLERAPLPRRGPVRRPPPPRGDWSTAAPGPHLEGGSAGVLDHVRPKGLGFCGIPRWHWLLLASCRFAYRKSDSQNMFCCVLCCVDSVLALNHNLNVWIQFGWPHFLPLMFMWLQVPRRVFWILPFWFQFKKEIDKRC